MHAWVLFVAAVSSVALAASHACSPDPQVWAVNNSATASDLAKAANCSGGAFDVEWIGHVEFPETVYVIDDTVMEITGAGAGAIADGADSKQFLNVINATLRVNGLRIENCATLNSGGAIYAESSSMSFNETTWSGNNASDNGGAVAVCNSRDVSWSGNTTWSNNTAGEDGGAVYVRDSSDVSWSGEMTWSNNTAGESGGAIYVRESSNVSWSGEMTWSHNTAGMDGGAVCVEWDISDVSWSGEMTWSHNTAGSGGGAGHPTAGSAGGAVNVGYKSSNVSWSGETTWSRNTAELGGAVCLYASSNVSWNGETTYSHNTAGADGGAVFMDLNSGVFWNGETTWSHNTAGEGGGATCLFESRDVSWRRNTTWSHNTASAGGGAVSVGDSSNVSWSGETTYSHNTAGEDGGGVIVWGSSKVSWSGETTWSYNTADLNGGAIYAFSSAVSMSDASSLFEGNTADAGGAVMLSGVDIGPKFVRTKFIANNSPRGGAVYSVSSGIATNTYGKQAFPIVYENCSFTDNRASVAGGAIESVAGKDCAENTVFERNAAGVGGALRLSGEATLKNCTFEDNTAEDEGPAISNLGVLYVKGNASRFSGNVFWCENETYLGHDDGNRYQTVCDGCPHESYWSGLVEDADEVPSCKAELDNTRSKGADTTIETLELNYGYWRTTNRSTNVLPCYNEDACRGGLTEDPAFCQLGYEGSYCSVCIEDYHTSLAFTCTKCPDDRDGIAITAVVGVFVLGAAVAVFMHLVSGEKEGTRRGVTHWLTERLPLQSIKIVVVVWQILTQFTSVANVTYPDVYQRFLDGVNILNFDPIGIPSAGCVVDVDFHGRLLVSTIAPLASLAVLAITYTVAKCRNFGSEAALQKVGQKHMSMVLLISFLVYSSVSSTVFQTFACEDLDDKEYLRADYRIECDSSKHRVFQVYAGIMIFVYPVGIPLFYAHLLYKNRRVLGSDNKAARETSPHVRPFSDLWFPYKPGRYYYELIECLRRMSLTGVVVFIYPNTAPQIAVTLMIAFSFVITSVLLAPYVSKWDASISLTGHVVVFTSMYTALLRKVNVSGERAESQEVFAGILVASHACMVVAVVVETVVIFFSIRRNDADGPRRCLAATVGSV